MQVNPAGLTLVLVALLVPAAGLALLPESLVPAPRRGAGRVALPLAQGALLLAGALLAPLLGGFVVISPRPCCRPATEALQLLESEELVAGRTLRF